MLRCLVAWGYDRIQLETPEAGRAWKSRRLEKQEAEITHVLGQSIATSSRCCSLPAVGPCSWKPNQLLAIHLLDLPPTELASDSGAGIAEGWRSRSLGKHEPGNAGAWKSRSLVKAGAWKSRQLRPRRPSDVIPYLILNHLASPAYEL